MKLPFRLPFNLPKINLNLSGVFNFSRKEILIISTSAGAVILFAVSISLIVAVSRGSSSGEAPAAQGVFSEIEADEGFESKQKPFLSDFLIYQDRMAESFTEAVSYREPLRSWSDEQVQQFWIDPDLIAIDLMEIEARKVIKDIFADVR